MNPYGYTGREIETNELYYYRARYYDAGTQRFLSVDPIGFESGDFNHYRYVGNDPVNFRDPSGLWATGAPSVGQGMTAMGESIGNFVSGAKDVIDKLLSPETQKKMNVDAGFVKLMCNDGKSISMTCTGDTFKGDNIGAEGHFGQLVPPNISVKVDGKKAQLNGSAGAMWSTVSGKVGVNFKIPFTAIKVKFGVKGHAGALGATAKATLGKGGAKATADAAIGLGAGAYFDISW